MGLLGSLNCFSSSKKTSKNRRKKQKQMQRSGNGGEQQLLVSPLSFTSSSTGKATSTMGTPRVSSSSSSKKQFATSLSANLVKSPLTPPRDDDNSIPTIDSTYNKYNSQFSLSDAGGTTGSHQQQSLASNYFTGADAGNHHVNNFWPMSPLSPFGAVTSPGHGAQLQSSLHQQQQQGVVKQREEYTIIYAPSGVLGVVIDTPPSSSSSSSSTNGNNDGSSSNGGRPVVHAIKDTCPIRDEIHVGDILIAVDDIDVTAMTAVEVSRLISRKSNQERRKLTLIRSGSSIGGSGSRLYDGRR